MAHRMNANACIEQAIIPTNNDTGPLSNAEPTHPLSPADPRASQPPLPPGEGRGEGTGRKPPTRPPLPPGEGRGEGAGVFRKHVPARRHANSDAAPATASSSVIQ